MNRVVIIVAVFLFAAILAVIEIVRELHTFTITEYGITSPKLSGLSGPKKLVFLSDLHGYEYGERNRKLVEAIADIHPDLILIGGDMVVGLNGHSFDPVFSFIKQIAQIAPCYHASGNHEQRMKEFPDHYDKEFSDYRETVKSFGIHYLENASVFVETDGVKTRITGFEIPITCYKKIHRVKMEPEEMERRIGPSRPDCYQILLAHNPGFMEDYLRYGADLILCGHLHGGVVRLPGVFGVISPSFQLFPKYSGDHYREGDTDIVVSKGLGTHTIHLRLFNPAEVVVLTLCGEEDS